MMEDGSDEREDQIPINGEGQYSLWPEFKAVPAGWEPAGPRSHKSACLTRRSPSSHAFP